MRKLFDKSTHKQFPVLNYAPTSKRPNFQKSKLKLSNDKNLTYK